MELLGILVRILGDVCLSWEFLYGLHQKYLNEQRWWSFPTLCNCESASSAHTCDASKYAEEIYTYDDKENC